MDIVNLIISLISGAVGGNIGGALTEKNLGVLANTIIGLLGGGAGDFLFKALGIVSAAPPAATGGGLDIASLLTTIGISGVSGGVITAIVSAIKNSMEKK